MLQKADADSIADSAISRFTQLGLTAKALKSRLVLAPVHVAASGVLDRVQALNQIRDAAESNGYLHIAWIALGRLSSLAIVRGEYDRAISLAREAEDQARHMGDLNGIASERVGRAEALIQIGRPSEAIGILRESLDYSRDQIEPSSFAYTRLVLADALLDAHGPGDSEAKSLLAEAADIPEGGWLSRAHLLVLAAEMYRRSAPAVEDPFEPVQKEFEALLLRCPHSVDPEVHYRSEMACANYYLKQGRLEEALSAATTALDHVVRASFLSYIARVYVVLAEIYERLGAESELARCLDSGRAVLEEASERISDPDTRRDFLARRVFRRLQGTSESGAPDRRLGALYDMIAVLNSETDPEALLESILEMALRVVEAERGMILLRDEKTDSFSIRLATNLEEETVLDVEAFSQSIVSQAGEGESILALDAGNDERFRDLKSVSLHKIRSLMCVPLSSRGRIIGTVYLDSRRRGRLFTKDDLGFVEAFANHAALALENARARARLEAENRRLLSVAGERARFDNIIGRCPAMQRVFDLIETMAKSELPLLIQGESGTGKELVARAIHFHGPRKRKVILSENSAAIPETLLESELFGHVRGAFTGADRDRPGLFEQADGGTLFLDEVGDMSAAMQARLLRVLQEGELRRVGGERAIHVDVRVIAATNKDLSTLVADGLFREDLLYRLQVLAIELPPLRDRPGDVPLLVDHLLERISRERGRNAPRIAGDVMDLLETYPWPGNVRQLESAMQRLVLLAGEGDITLPVVETDSALRDAFLGSRRREPVYSLELNEKAQIERALEASGGNRNKAARMLGISRATIYRKIKEYGLN
jgi:Nif-specific regulatory protein